MVVLEIANSVSPNTRLSVDYPSAHPSGWMPLLDIQVRVASDNTNKVELLEEMGEMMMHLQ